MSSPHRPPDHLRDAILQAALVEFRRHGFDAASLDRIAAAAGVSRRTVRKHFADKDALFDALLPTSCGAERAYRPDRPLRDQLLSLLQQRIRVLDDGHVVDPRRDAGSSADEGDAAWFRAAMADRRLQRVDPVFAAYQLRGLLKGLAFWAPAQREPMVNCAVERFLGCYA